MRSRLAKRLVVVILAAAAALPTPAQAMSKPVRTILVASLYGAAAGTAVGVVGAILTSNLKAMFVGTSVGLYLGAALGAYYLIDRDPRSNPLRRMAGEPANLPVYGFVQDLRPEGARNPRPRDGTMDPCARVVFTLARF